MGLPEIDIIFKSKAAEAIKSGSDGIGGIIIRDNGAAPGGRLIYRASEVPAGLKAENERYIKSAFAGNVYTPKLIYLYILEEGAESVEDALKWFMRVRPHRIVAPPNCTQDEAADIALWVEECWNDKYFVRATLPNTAADFEGVENYTSKGIIIAGESITTAQDCARIMGIILGTPISRSVTNVVRTEVEKIEMLSKQEINQRINNGELLCWYDGEKVKIARGVNSLKVPNAEQNEDYKSIKFIETIAKINRDLIMGIDDGYIGSPGSYDNKVLLMSAIGSYLRELEDADILEKGSTVEIDIDAQSKYLKGKGIDISKMTEEQIKIHPTGNTVFLVVRIKIIGAIETVVLVINH